ncbi:lipid-binding SYLF domain-containing protein [Mangrovimonas aestuarii]|uniref:lipid-binding SYLF domain-containing protein n=1 Tax=Mangrovimonas aestuarii TaxID=3018443 RepID=UPI0023790C45|nr:lipid-binding SYLF domain-containing protein [Mangrovimonas aestuarii]
MKNLKFLLIVFTLGFFTSTLSAQNDKDQKIIDDAKTAKETLLTENPDLKDFFDKAAGYVIFPNVGKGGFIVGGASGNGVVYESGEMVGMASLKMVDVGFQAGGQAIIEVIFFETQKDLDKFKEGNFNFAAGASATVLKSGASFDAKYADGIAVFTHAKGGLMAEAAVGGQKFKYKPLK